MDNENSGADQENSFDPNLDIPSGVEGDEADVETLKKNVATLNAQKKHWREKAVDPTTGKPYKELFEAAQQAKNNQPAEGDDVKKDIQWLKAVEEKRQFGYQHGLSPEEADQVFNYAQGAGIKPEKALEHPFVKSGLESLKATQRAQSATPRPSSRSPLVEGKTFKDLKPEERKANWEKITKGYQK